MKFFKIIFSIVLMIIATLWILYTISFFGLYHDGWEWVQKIPGISWINEKIAQWVNSVDTDQRVRVLGLQMFLAGGAVLLGYLSVCFIVTKIPVIGGIIKFIAPTIGIITIILGSILLWANLDWLPGSLKGESGDTLPKDPQMLTMLKYQLLNI